jgi:site-specific recombinase XerD
MAPSFIPLETVRGLDHGPLVPHVGAYIERVRGEGYPPKSVLVHVQLIASFNQYLRRTRREVRDVNERLVARFIRCDARAQWSPGPAVTLRRLLVVLREAKVVPPASAPPDRRTPAQRFTDNFRAYLRKERGLSETAIYGYTFPIDSFLARMFGTGKVSFARLTGCDVTDFLPWEIKRRRLHHTANLLAGMRAFLRFLHYRGHIKTDLSPVVPRAAKWSLAGLPKHLPPGAADKVLAACDRTRPRGRRDYAILLLLARLGLRAGEVLRLMLDDLDWEHGQILVRSKKGPGHARMPLPSDVGRAIAVYLRRDRPRCPSRRVFLRVIAPYESLSHAAVLSGMVERYLRLAGIGGVRKGAHVFRHTLATDMLRGGASLGEIGQVLRHSNPNSTAIYAKVDLEALRSLALPWPGGVS